ncbi:hypothetical protein J1C67_14600 [Clostridium gasigenes]|uniref:DUF6731 family protein n=1 Tax=Clostridium gasigenes TaxID=94869 RepID=UPI0014383B83|nr:DUF6731 family protein [Clostridium gasigenes]NKF05313.1 hypothetical protein [Clostridium gasigenes]QSW18766.1 hypothetical protein J1C67_14600 [Clostridium gasigenes]
MGTNKKVKVYYYIPTMNKFGKEITYPITQILEGLIKEELRDRVYGGTDENIQLKEIKRVEGSEHLWKLCFFKNISESNFKSKIEDEVDEAEPLEDDEYMGQESCCIYDERNSIMAIQNNRYSTSFKGIEMFLKNFIDFKNWYIKPIIGENIEIGEQDTREYKSIIISYIDIKKISQLAGAGDIDAIKNISALANDIGALNGKVELSVGREKSNYLFKGKVGQLLNFLIENKKYASSLKLKVIDKDGVRLIDLINNKVFDEFYMTVSKGDPKAVSKIMNPMITLFEKKLDGELKMLNNVVKK